MSERRAPLQAPPNQTWVVPAAVAAPVLWSAGNLIVRGAPVDPSLLAVWRMFFGAALYQAIWWWRGGSMSMETLRIAAAGGVGFGLQAVLFYTALQTTSVISAMVIFALQPLMLMPFSRRLFGESVGVRRLLLTVIAIGGTAMVVAGSTSGGRWTLWGDLLALGGASMGCLYFIGTKKARERLDALEYQAAALVAGAVVGTPVAALLAGGLAGPDGGELIWPVLMTLIAGSGHLLMNAAQRFLTVGATSTLALAATPLTALGAALVFGEPVTWLQMSGMALVLGALGIFTVVVPMKS